MLKNLIKPKKINSGDTVATVSLSWGGPGEIFSRYLQGKEQIESTFNIKVIEAPNSLKSNDYLYNNPKARLDDLLWAFENPEAKAIFTTIGGSDSIRLASLMNESHYEIIKRNAKPFIGMSDSTVQHFICMKAGIRSFYGPSVMFGLAENCGIHEYTKNSFMKTLFSSEVIGDIDAKNNGVILKKYNWGEEDSIIRPREQNSPWRFIQGNGIKSGRLIGGCIDVIFTMLVGTELFPDKENFNGSILFIETTDAYKSADYLAYWLRNLGTQGILDKLNGILYSKPGIELTTKGNHYRDDINNYYSISSKHDQEIIKVCKEFGASNLPIVTNMDFGHIVPQMIIPYGALAHIDCDSQRISIVESAVI